MYHTYDCKNKTFADCVSFSFGIIATSFWIVEIFSFRTVETSFWIIDTFHFGLLRLHFRWLKLFLLNSWNYIFDGWVSFCIIETLYLYCWDFILDWWDFTFWIVETFTFGIGKTTFGIGETTFWIIETLHFGLLRLYILDWWDFTFVIGETLHLWLVILYIWDLWDFTFGMVESHAGWSALSLHGKTRPSHQECIQNTGYCNRYLYTWSCLCN